MGLFGFGKSKKVVTTTPSEFLAECIEDFHQEAAKFGVAKKGNIFVPELMMLGREMALTFVSDEFNRSEYGHNPVVFYFVVNLCVWHAGLAIAAKWHTNFEQLEHYVNDIKILGPGDDAVALLEKYFPASISQNDGEDFLQHIYDRWLKMHKPYEDLADPRQYTLNAIIATFQLGVSMMLEKLGY